MASDYKEVFQEQNAESTTLCILLFYNSYSYSFTTISFIIWTNVWGHMTIMPSLSLHQTVATKLEVHRHMSREGCFSKTVGDVLITYTIQSEPLTEYFLKLMMLHSDKSTLPAASR